MDLGGRGVERAIGVNDAAGIGRIDGASVDTTTDIFEHGLDLIALGESTASSPPARASGLTLPTEHRSGNCSMSFAFAWLFSGRGHLPGLMIFNSEEGATANFSDWGAGADSKEDQTAVSKVSG
jgi:hypothetical protein